MWNLAPVTVTLLVFSVAFRAGCLTANGEPEFIYPNQTLVDAVRHLGENAGPSGRDADTRVGVDSEQRNAIRHRPRHVGTNAATQDDISDASKEAEVSTEHPIQKSHKIVKRQQPNNGLCVRNEDCASLCCIFRNAIHGNCAEQAYIGQICGFIASPQYVDATQFFKVCEADVCSTQCCCRDRCCPTDYCVKILAIQSEVCTKCASGCCCNERCCPVQYCHDALLQMLTTQQVQDGATPTACTRCQSGCCCGDECCLAFQCRGQRIGFRCEECQTGCCCGRICCAASYCEQQDNLQPYQRLGLYHGMNERYLPFFTQTFGRRLFESMDDMSRYKPFGAIRSDLLKDQPIAYQNIPHAGTTIRGQSVPQVGLPAARPQVRHPAPARQYTQQELMNLIRRRAAGQAVQSRILQLVRNAQMEQPVAAVGHRSAVGQEDGLKTMENIRPNVGLASRQGHVKPDVPPGRQRSIAQTAPLNQVLPGRQMPITQTSPLKQQPPGLYPPPELMSRASTSDLLSYFGVSAGKTTSGKACLSCTTGCCCDFGCCNGSYCMNSDE